MSLSQNQGDDQVYYYSLLERIAKEVIDPINLRGDNLLDVLSYEQRRYRSELSSVLLTGWVENFGAFLKKGGIIYGKAIYGKINKFTSLQLKDLRKSVLSELVTRWTVEF